MTRHHPPRLALALLERFVPDSEPLAGDLVEEFERRQSPAWFWWQVATAIASASRGIEIRPLRLVDLQPADALERSRRWRIQWSPVNLSASPVAGVGGLGLVIFACLVTLVMPVVWGVLLASAFAGAALGLVMIAMRGGIAPHEPQSIRVR